MTHLEISEPVACPADFTAATVELILRGKSGPGEPVRIELRVPSATLHAPGLVDVTRAVTAQLAAQGAEDGLHRLNIRWEPEAGGPFPAFRGDFLVRESADGNSLLTLEGDYDPPGGLAGEAFDAALGHRMAEAAIRGLLVRLREACEHDYLQRVADGSRFD